MRQQLRVALGPILFCFIYGFSHFQGLSDEGLAVLATTGWMASWWILESMPMAITALLPVILFPITGVLTFKETGATYSHPIIFLFIGGFMIAAAIEKWQLHTRVALGIISLLGRKPKSIILGFMLATAALSMCISNTVTTIMMLPIGLAIIEQLSKQFPQDMKERFAKALLLAIAYSASIGGIATLIGTPTNLIFAGIISEQYNKTVSFAAWMVFAAPVSLLLLFICWLFLVNISFKLPSTIKESFARDTIKQYRAKLGLIKKEELVILAVFLLVAFCWMTRSTLIVKLIPNISDPMIAIIGAMLLFMIPSFSKNSDSGKREMILDWQTAVKIPWGVILLFGGGLSLAKGFTSSGLASWIGLKLSFFGVLPIFLLLLAVIALVNFLTEITSNIATISMILPVLAALAQRLGIDPYSLMVGATCAASCAFMLPVATAPNAIVFGSTHLHIRDMIKAGAGLNIISIVLFSIYCYYIPITS